MLGEGPFPSSCRALVLLCPIWSTGLTSSWSLIHSTLILRQGFCPHVFIFSQRSWYKACLIPSAWALELDRMRKRAFSPTQPWGNTVLIHQDNRIYCQARLSEEDKNLCLHPCSSYVHPQLTP